MREITETKMIYRFSELSDNSKDIVRTWYAQHGIAWQDEWLDSIKALARHFGGKMERWEIDFYNCSHSSARFDMPELTAKEIKRLLGELGTYNRKTGRGNGECKLTGYCGDEDAIDGFRLAYRKGERDLSELMQAAFDTWLKASQADTEYQLSDESLEETCEANDQEFDENGKYI